MKYYWGTERRFNAYADYFRSRFGERVQKLTVNAGFTCPNRDGKVGRGGCTFCDNRAFNPSYNNPHKPVEQQLREGIEFHKHRYRKVSKYLAYFQAYTNTYAPLDDLKKIYQPAIDHPYVVGLVIGTRPDCISEPLLDYLAELSKQLYVIVEYGIESVNNDTLKAINRGHDFETSVRAIEMTSQRGIHVGGHIIIGLPGEDRQMWMKSIDRLSALPLSTVKFHQLQLIRGTAMEEEYRLYPERFVFFDMEDYLQLMCDMLERLNPAFVVERIAGEVNPGTASKEDWGVRYDRVLARFEEIMKERDTWQGRLFETD